MSDLKMEESFEILTHSSDCLCRQVSGEDFTVTLWHHKMDSLSKSGEVQKIIEGKVTCTDAKSGLIQMEYSLSVKYGTLQTLTTLNNIIRIPKTEFALEIVFNKLPAWPKNLILHFMKTKDGRGKGWVSSPSSYSSCIVNSLGSSYVPLSNNDSSSISLVMNVESPFILT